MKAVQVCILISIIALAVHGFAQDQSKRYNFTIQYTEAMGFKLHSESTSASSFDIITAGKSETTTSTEQWTQDGHISIITIEDGQPLHIMVNVSKEIYKHDAKESTPDYLNIDVPMVFKEGEFILDDEYIYEQGYSIADREVLFELDYGDLENLYAQLTLNDQYLLPHKLDSAGKLIPLTLALGESWTIPTRSLIDYTQFGYSNLFTTDNPTVKATGTLKSVTNNIAKLELEIRFKGKSPLFEVGKTENVLNISIDYDLTNNFIVNSSRKLTTDFTGTLGTSTITGKITATSSTRVTMD